MKRKLIIGTALALVVGVVLVWTSWTEDGPPPVSIAYEDFSRPDPPWVYFMITVQATNSLYTAVTQQFQTNGAWTSMTNAYGFGFYLSGNGEQRYAQLPPDGTNMWRMVVHYYHPALPTDNFMTRSRTKLAYFVQRHQWPRLQRWLSPVKIGTVYGPEMMGLKPVETK